MSKAVPPLTSSGEPGLSVPIPIPVAFPLIKVLAPVAPNFMPPLAVITPTESIFVTSS